MYEHLVHGLGTEALPVEAALARDHARLDRGDPLLVSRGLGLREGSALLLHLGTEEVGGREGDGDGARVEDPHAYGAGLGCIRVLAPAGGEQRKHRGGEKHGGETKEVLHGIRGRRGGQLHVPKGRSRGPHHPTPVLPGCEYAQARSPAGKWDGDAGERRRTWAECERSEAAPHQDAKRLDAAPFGARFLPLLLNLGIDHAVNFHNQDRTHGEEPNQRDVPRGMTRGGRRLTLAITGAWMAIASVAGAPARVRPVPATPHPSPSGVPASDDRETTPALTCRPTANQARCASRSSPKADRLLRVEGGQCILPFESGRDSRVCLGDLVELANAVRGPRFVIAPEAVAHLERPVVLFGDKEVAEESLYAFVILLLCINDLVVEEVASGFPSVVEVHPPGTKRRRALRPCPTYVLPEDLVDRLDALRVVTTVLRTDASIPELIRDARLALIDVSDLDILPAGEASCVVTGTEVDVATFAMFVEEHP